MKRIVLLFVVLLATTAQAYSPALWRNTGGALTNVDGGATDTLAFPNTGSDTLIAYFVAGRWYLSGKNASARVDYADTAGFIVSGIYILAAGDSVGGTTGLHDFNRIYSDTISSLLEALITLRISGDDFTDLKGAGLQNSGGALQVDTLAASEVKSALDLRIDDSKLSDSSITLLNATAWRMFFSNATTTAIQELAFGTTGKVLTSNGASANPTWDTPATGVWTDGGDIIHPTTGATDSVVVGGTTAANSDITLGGDGSAVFNEQGAAVDFRIEGDTSQFLLEVNGSKSDTGEVNITGGFNVNLPADDNITIDARTNNRTVTVGALRLNHTPQGSTPGTRAVYIDVDANSVASTQGIHVSFKATALVAGETGIGIDVEGVTSSSTGGDIQALHVSKSGIGSAEVHAVHASAGVHVIDQLSGSFTSPTQAWKRDTSLTVWANLTSPDAVGSSAIDSTLFDEVDDYLYIGNAVTFSEIDFVFNTFAGGAGINPTFEFSIAGPAWTAFTPIDNTDGCRQDGGIEWAVADLTSWASVTVNGVASYYIRILKNQGGAATDPIEDRIRISVTTEYQWNSDGDVNINSLTTPLVIGGTGTTSDLSLKTTSGVGATGADMHFLMGNDGATEAMTILNNGRVGIGTNAPNAPLEVKGTLPGNVGGFASGMFHVTGGGTAQFSNSVITGHSAYSTNTQLWYLGSMSSSDDDIGLLNRQNGDINFYTNNAFRMRIVSAGNVGINVTDPDTKLEILNAGNQLKLSFDGTDNTILAVNTSGDLTITPSGTKITVAGNLDVSGTVDGVDVAALNTGVATDSGSWNAWEEIDGATRDTIRWIDPAADTSLVITSDGSGNVLLTVGKESDNSAQTLRVEMDTIKMGDDIIADLSGNNMTVTSGALNVAVLDTLTTTINHTQWDEHIKDNVGDMVTGNTETGITVTYQDADNTLDFVITQVADVDTAGTDIAAALADRANAHDTVTRSFVISAIDDTYDFPFWMTIDAITIIAANGVCIGGTNVIGVLMEYDNDAANPVVCNSSDWTFTTGEERTTSLSNASIDAGDYLGWRTTSVSGTVDFFTLTFEYTVP